MTGSCDPGLAAGPRYDPADDHQDHGVFGWVYAGELKVFEPGELDQAKTWVAAAS